MSEFHVSGSCIRCGEMCFEVLAVWGGNERYPGEPKRLGPANPDATRISFVLMDGTRADLTFCGKCSEVLTPADYTPIWRKVIRGWNREMKDAPRPKWYREAFNNGLLGEMGRVKWRALNG